MGYYSPRLRVTERCASDDLDLDPERLILDCRQRVDEHDVLRTFVEKRSLLPDEGEAIVSVSPQRAIKSLHVGRGRGATQYDRDFDVCWLLAFSATHASGERRDVYSFFEALLRRDELFPTIEDYLILDEATTAEQLAELADLCRQAIADANRTPGVEAQLRLMFGGALAALVDFIVIDADTELRQGWVTVRLLEDAPLDVDQVLDIVARSLPADADRSSLRFTDRFGNRTLHWQELCWTWDSI